MAIEEGLKCGQVVCTPTWFHKTGYYTCAVVIEIKQILDLITPQDCNLNRSPLIEMPLQGSTFVKVL